LRLDTIHSWSEGDGASIVQGHWLFDPSVSSRTLDAPSVALSTDAVSRARRSALCSCGSGLRFKHCCGWEASAAQSNDALALETERQAALIQRAASLMQRGEAARASSILASLRPDLLNALQNREAGEMCIDIDMLQHARNFLQRSIEQDARDPHTLESMEECRRLIDRPAKWTAAGQSLRAQLDTLNSHTAQVSAIRQLHIVCKLDTLGGTESRATNLYRQLSAIVPTTLWSTHPVHAAHAAKAPLRQITANDVPSGGALALIGTYFECGDWLEKEAFDRVVVCHNLSEQYGTLGRRLSQIEMNPSHPEVRLTFPSELFKQTSGLPGRVEYSPIDLAAFRCRVPRTAGRRLTVGRHGRAHPMKFHPNDPAFFRSIMARGHGVKLLGGTQIAPMFAYDVERRPELLAVGAQNVQTFLESLDVFVHRIHPHFLETGGTVILEAMAMELPVIIFSERCGSTELIEHGENGFLVSTEAEALAVIDRLSNEVLLRERVGRAARASIVELMRRTEASIADSYFA
jgi:glycosyl transferase family 1/SEC-C motif-containing protein